jgi:holliday junction DNA helicase RuvA
MIASIRGTVLWKEPDSIVVETNGVGYQIFTTQSLLSQVEIGQAIFLYTIQHVREDAVQLFGFLDPNEKSTFVTLQSVTGIGPKASLSILNAASPAQLAAAIDREDAAFLTQLPGVGKKTAQRLIVELKDKFGYYPSSDVQPSTRPSMQEIPQDMMQEVSGTLAALGYQEREIRDVLQRIRQADPLPTTVEAWVKLALREFTKM